MKVIFAAFAATLAFATPAAAGSVLDSVIPFVNPSMEPPGYLFSAPAPEGARATEQRGGRMVVDIEITLTSPIPASQVITCYSSFGHSGETYHSDQASTQAKRSGKRATCSIAIPYLWPNAESTGFVSGSVNVYAGGRSHNRGLIPFPIPKNNAVTRFKEKIVL